MSSQVNLYSLAYFRTQAHLQALNELVAINTNLMPHQVAVATGCGLADAMRLLVMATHNYLADAFSLVYHSAHPSGPPVMKRSLKDGPPSIPFVCELCQEEVTDRGNLVYDFLFELDASKGLTFVAEAS